MKNEVVVLIGSESIGQAIARRIGNGKHIVLGDKNLENAKKVKQTLYDAGFECSICEVDISSRESILNIIKHAKKYGEITNLINAAGVSPSQAPIEAILKVDLYGTAVVLEEFGKVMADGGSGVVISSQSGHRLPALSPKEDELLATTPTEDLLNLDILKVENIENTLKAYQLSKRANVLRVAYESINWGMKDARINSISPGIIITPLANDELNGPLGENYKTMLESSPVGRAGTPDEVANLASFLMSSQAAFISGSDFLMDGGTTASYKYGPLSKLDM